MIDDIGLTSREKCSKTLNNSKFRGCKELKNGNFNFQYSNTFCNFRVNVNNNDQIFDQSKNLNHSLDVHSDQVISK